MSKAKLTKSKAVKAQISASNSKPKKYLDQKDLPELTYEQVINAVSFEADMAAYCANEGQASAIIIKRGIENGKPVMCSEVVMFCDPENIEGNLAAVKNAILKNEYSHIWNLKKPK